MGNENTASFLKGAERGEAFARIRNIMTITTGAQTHVGRRAANQDRYAVLDSRRLCVDAAVVIADGMGGRQGGETASVAAIEVVEDSLAEMLVSSGGAASDIGEALVSAIRKANARVYDLARADSGTKGMGTTCVAAVIVGSTLFVSHAGDSRAYLWSGGNLKRLTEDHSFVAEQVRAGILSEGEARQSQFRNVITRAVGIEPTLTADVASYAFGSGDVLLLCTDGLTGPLEEDDIAQVLDYPESAQAKADRLVALAYKQGGTDNITAVIVQGEITKRAVQPAKDPLPAAPKMPPAKSHVSKAPLGILTVLALAFALLFADAAWVLSRDGYGLVSAFPFAAKPPPPPVPKPPDLGALTYGSPVGFFISPVRPDVLTYSAGKDAVTVVTQSNQMVRLSAGGQIQAKWSATLPKGTGTLTASDAQGNLYVASQTGIARYQPNGTVLPSVAKGLLKAPTALAVGIDGTIYIIDAGRLEVIRGVR